MSWQASMTSAPIVLDPYTGQSAPAAGSQHKGLRIKVGLDCGKLKGEINCMTGRMVRAVTRLRGRCGLGCAHRWCMCRSAEGVRAHGKIRLGQVTKLYLPNEGSLAHGKGARCAHCPAATQIVALQPLGRGLALGGRPAFRGCLFRGHQGIH